MTERSIDGCSGQGHQAHLAPWDDIRASEVVRISTGHGSACRMTDNLVCDARGLDASLYGGAAARKRRLGDSEPHRIRTFHSRYLRCNCGPAWEKPPLFLAGVEAPRCVTVTVGSFGARWCAFSSRENALSRPANPAQGWVQSSYLWQTVKTVSAEMWTHRVIPRRLPCRRPALSTIQSPVWPRLPGL